MYWRLKGPARLFLVVASSYFFYMSWMPIYGILLAALSTLCWFTGLAIDKYRDSSPKLSKMILVLGIIFNLACLCYYKYSNFILANLFGATSWLGTQMHLAQL
ncbi:MAG: hypothetical protein K2X81_06945, partial [Candidatus Obscuribacterales bacterium]|nr:hypothetical protein [Candidatus Obscuribacterales bacterium]